MSEKTYVVHECDVLVIGGGGSGALAAVEAEAAGLKVAIAAKGPIGQSGLTPTGNGGTAAGPAELLFDGMLTAGRFLNDQNLVMFMAANAERCVERLNDFGVPVARYKPTRVCVPGPEAMRALRASIIARPRIELLEDMLVTGLLCDSGRVTGAVGLDLESGELTAFSASAVVLATGGLTGELYSRTSNNPFGITTGASATGHVMAFRAGAEIIDPEMIQFVPLPAEPRCRNLRYFPDFWSGPYENRLGEVVESNVEQYPGLSYSWQLVRAIYRENKEGRGPVYIDQRGRAKPPAKGLVKSWDVRRGLIKSMGIDPAENKVEITLGSHFCMGGVRVSEKTETTIPGLFAAGEIMGGLHGAVRIPGHSFTQMIVFGIEAGRQAAAWVSQAGRPARPRKDEVEAEGERLARFIGDGPGESLKSLAARLQATMEEGLFIERDAPGIRRALSGIRAIKEAASAVRVPAFRRFNLDWVRAIELGLLVEAAELVGEGALMREETRAFHWRTDFPEEDNGKWLRHTVFRRQAGQIAGGTAPVNLTYRSPEV